LPGQHLTSGIDGKYSAGGMMPYDEQVCLMVYYIFNSGATFIHFAGILGVTESTT